MAKSNFEVRGGDLPYNAANGGANQELDSFFKLEAALKEQFERAFDADFEDVRIHTGAFAHQITRNASADAVTIGSDIYFGAGKFAPETEAGVSLLAHELQHVVQNQEHARLVYIEDREELETEAESAEAASGLLRLHNITAPLLRQDDTPTLKSGELAEAAHSAFDGGREQSAVNADRSITDFLKRRGKPLIRYYAKNGQTLEMTQAQYEKGLDIVKHRLLEHLEELRLSLPEEEYAQIVLKCMNPLSF